MFSAFFSSRSDRLLFFFMLPRPPWPTRSYRPFPHTPPFRSPLPLLVDSAADWAGEAHAGLAVSTVWLAGNAGAAAVIYGFSQLADRALWNWAGLVLSALLISEALLAPLLRPQRV